MKKYISLIGLLLTPLIVNAQGTVVADSFYSNSLGFMRHMNVYLPEGYDTTTIAYSMIYFLHGAGGNHNSYSAIYGILDYLIGNQIIEPVIFISPDGSVSPYWGSWYTNSELYGDFENYIAFDLVEYIDTTYRTISARDKRCVMGHSMGGYGCMKLALKHPDLYKAAASHSGALEHNIYFPDWVPIVLNENGGSPPYNYTWNAGILTNCTFTVAGAYSPDTTDPPYFVDFPLDSMGNIIDSVLARWEPHNLPKLAAQLPPDTNLALYFDCGMYDEFYFYSANTAFADSLDLLGILYEFQSFAGGHSNQFLSRVYISLAFLDSVMNTGIEEEQRIIPVNKNCPTSTIFSGPLQLPEGKKCKVFDITGRIVAPDRIQPGIYFIEVDGKIAQKIVKVR